MAPQLAAAVRAAKQQRRTLHRLIHGIALLARQRRPGGHLAPAVHLRGGVEAAAHGMHHRQPAMLQLHCTCNRSKGRACLVLLALERLRVVPVAAAPAGQERALEGRLDSRVGRQHSARADAAASHAMPVEPAPHRTGALASASCTAARISSYSCSCRASVSAMAALQYAFSACGAVKNGGGQKRVKEAGR